MLPQVRRRSHEAAFCRIGNGGSLDIAISTFSISDWTDLLRRDCGQHYSRGGQKICRMHLDQLEEVSKVRYRTSRSIL